MFDLFWLIPWASAWYWLGRELALLLTT